jgi:neutral trehalase
MFNTLLSASLAATARLQSALAAEESLDEQTRSRLGAAASDSSRSAEAVAGAVRRKLWDDEAGYFHSYDLREANLLRTPTVASFMPLLGDVATGEQAEKLIHHLRNPDGFAVDFPIPSTLPSSAVFNPVRYWSGPTWPVTNWLVWRGLRERGHPLASDIRSSTLDMISEGVSYDEVVRAAMSVMRANSAGEGGEEYTTPSTRQYRHAWLWDSAITAAAWPYVLEEPVPHNLRPGRPGFWEYYHPLTGQPLGAPYMTWTAAVFLDMLPG